MGLLDWLGGGGSGAKKPVHSFDQVLADGKPDPWTELMFWADDPAGRWRMHLGKNPTHWVKSEERRQVLVLGPPQSDKTTGVIVPLVMSSPGPVVSTSTKPDVWQATAQTRARMGTLWHFAVDGRPTLPGCIPLRWSPIGPSSDWGVALMLGKAMAESSGMSENVGNADYFKSRAGDLIACLLHAAAIGERDMRWMLRAVALQMATLREAQEDLYDSDGPDSMIAADLLASFISLDSRSRDSIWSTASTAFAAYRVPGALATTLDANFDPAAFVAGDPDEQNSLRWRPFDWREPGLSSMGIGSVPCGTADTIFICASSEMQNLVAPIVVGLLSRITAATYTQHANDEQSGVRDRRPVFFVLDEIANVAPMGELPSMLSQAAGQGLLICACLQDLAQARSRWRDDADGFLTLFGNVLVFPGIRDERTLKLISELTGKYWHTMTSESRGETDGKESYSTSVSEQLVDVLTPSDIASGRDALDGVPNQDRLLLLWSEGWCYCFSTPYYRDHFFQTLLLCNAAAPRRLHERLELPADHPMLKAPLPLLARDGNTHWLREVGGAARVQWFHDIQEWHKWNSRQ